MPDNEKMKGKLVLYLSTLSESAQLLLLKSLERDAGKQSHDRATQLILDALKEVLRKSQPVIPLSDYVRATIFRPCEPFVSTIDHINKVEARISPSSLDAIWAWIKRDIATKDQQKRFEEACNDVDEAIIAQKANILCQELMAATNAYITKLKRDPEGPQRLGNQLGGANHYKDLLEILICSEKLENLKPVLSKLPQEISNWTSPEGEDAFLHLSRQVQQQPLKTAWIVSSVTGRLTKPRLKLELAIRLAGSDDAIQVAATVYAPAVHQVMADLESQLALFEKSMKSIGDTKTSIGHLTAWRSLARAVETDLELAAQCPWGRAIAEMKTKLSALLEPEIDAAPGLVRKSLRTPKNGASEQADEALLHDAKRAVELFGHVERMKESLALNAEVSRVRKEMDQSFEILTTSLVERTKKALGDEAKACKILGDAAVEMARHIFDEDYASSLRRQLRAASLLQGAVPSEAEAVGA